MGVPGLLRLEVLHGHLPVVAGEVPQEDALHLVRELKHLCSGFHHMLIVARPVRLLGIGVACSSEGIQGILYLVGAAEWRPLHLL